MKSLKLSFFALVLLFQGCSIIQSASQPLSHSPENIQIGCHRDWVDSNYGYPIATGFTEDGTEYVEQIQFVDGTPIGWKVFRITLHSVADTFTCFLWEFIGFPMEVALSNHSEYVYYLVYDERNHLVRKMAEDTEEGRLISKLAWTSPRLPTEKWGRAPSVARLALDDRMEMIKNAKGFKERGTTGLAEMRRTSQVPQEDVKHEMEEINRLHMEKVIDDEMYKSMLIRLGERTGAEL